MTRDELQALAIQTARAYQLDPKIVCGVVEQESSWDTNAIRFEGSFFMTYVKPLNLQSETEAMSRAFSWGLMQVMGQVAREFSFKAQYLSALCVPVAGLDIGCRVLRAKLNSRPSTIDAGLLAYNGGGNPLYAKQVLAKAALYVCLKHSEV